MEIKIIEREQQHYAAICAQTTLSEIPTKLPPLITEVYNWLKAHEVQPAGPLFFSYNMLADGAFDVEVGVPVSNEIKGDERVKAGNFPAGTYAVATYIGPYEGLHEAHRELEQKRRHKQVGPTIEYYVIGPESENDPAKWETEIVAQVEIENA